MNVSLIILIFGTIISIVLIVLILFKTTQHNNSKQLNPTNNIKSIIGSVQPSMCIVFCNYNNTDFIKFLANQSKFVYVITHLYIKISWTVEQLQPPNLFMDVSNGTFISSLISQINYLESNVLSELQNLQENGIKLVLS